MPRPVGRNEGHRMEPQKNQPKISSALAHNLRKMEHIHPKVARVHGTTPNSVKQIKVKPHSLEGQAARCMTASHRALAGLKRSK